MVHQVALTEVRRVDASEAAFENRERLQRGACAPITYEAVGREALQRAGLLANHRHDGGVPARKAKGSLELVPVHRNFNLHWCATGSVIDIVLLEGRQFEFADLEVGANTGRRGIASVAA